MTKEYGDIAEWIEDQLKLVKNEWDNVHLVTGEEGVGKSLWMRKVARKLDPELTVERIHFTQDNYLNDAAQLDVGRAIIMDEFRGHRRLAMHGDRQEFLDFTKECRAMSLHQFIGYPHINQFERDLLTNRIRYWEHIPRRGFVEIRERVSILKFRKTREGPEPYMETRWPLVGQFPFTEKNDPLKPLYLEKKYDRMRDRAARFRESHGGEAMPMSTAPAQPRLAWGGARPPRRPHHA
ncbi:MAG: hypothetical protein ACYC2H_10125 [Thermoplasmatota archaeon]